MMATATPCYDPDNPAWGSIVQAAYDSAHGAIRGTLVPFAISAGGTMDERLAWATFSFDHPIEAGVVTAHLQADSVDPLQALYHLVRRCIISGYHDETLGQVQRLEVVTTCPNCRTPFSPWGHIFGGGRS